MQDTTDTYTDDTFYGSSRTASFEEAARFRAGPVGSPSCLFWNSIGRPWPRASFAAYMATDARADHSDFPMGLAL